MSNRHPVNLKDYPEVKRLILAADSSYRKHQATVVVVDRVPLQGTYWSDGNRSTYNAVDMLTGRSAGAPQYDPPQFGGPRETPVVTIPENVAIVETGTSRGETARAYVYVRAANVTKLLPNLQS